MLFWTKGATEIYGYTSDEACGKQLAELIEMPGHPVQLELGADFEYLRRRKDGQAVYIGAACKALYSALGEVQYIIHSQNDITDAKALRDARQVESRYRGLLESMPDAIVMANSTGRIVLVNSQAERLFGFEPRELLASRCHEGLPAANAELFDGLDAIRRKSRRRDGDPGHAVLWIACEDLVGCGLQPFCAAEPRLKCDVCLDAERRAPSAGRFGRK